jgi:glycosyltransferase involved in cell wall biosynthesis
LPLYPRAIESFDLKNYDAIISTSHAVAKGVIPGPKTFHISYIHTPMRYAWDMRSFYFGDSSKGWLLNPKKRFVQRQLHKLRIWDVSSNHRIDTILANSQNTRHKIKKYWGRDSIILYPPVDTEYFIQKTELAQDKLSNDFNIPFSGKEFYLVVASFVPYKKTELAIGAAIQGKFPLIVTGSGPAEKKYRKLIKNVPNVKIISQPNKALLRFLYQNAKALIYPQEEDFGIIPVEAMACGAQVIAYGAGGALETVQKMKTGLFFEEQSEASLNRAIQDFENLTKGKSGFFNKRDMQKYSQRFSIENFRSKFIKIFENEFKKFRKSLI